MSDSDSVEGRAKHHCPLVLLASLQSEEERERWGEDDQQEGAGMEETCDEPASPGPGGPLNSQVEIGAVRAIFVRHTSDTSSV